MRKSSENINENNNRESGVRQYARMAVLTAIFLVTGLMCGCGASDSANDSARIAFDSVTSAQETADSADTESDSTSGEPAADNADFNNLNSFNAKTLDGEDYSASDFADADLTVINCWSVTCNPCIDEMPDLAKFAKKLPDNVHFITYCIDGIDYAEYADEIMRDAGYKGITLITGGGDLAELNTKIQYMPTTLFVDNKGNLVGKPIIGTNSRITDQYTEVINDALASMGKQTLS